MSAPESRFIPAEELRAGDVVRYLAPHPWVTVAEIRPYAGPLDCVFALAETRPGCGFSLCRGDVVEVAGSR